MKWKLGDPQRESSQALCLQASFPLLGGENRGHNHAFSSEGWSSITVGSGWGDRERMRLCLPVEAEGG